MSTIYLDKTGLAYFWSKIKAWCSSLFALDSNVVHKTGDELVQGVKEFKNAYDDTSDSSMPDSSHSIVLRTTRYRKGIDFSTLSYNDFINIIFQDNAGNLINHDGRMASIDYGANRNGAYYLDILCFKNSLSEPDDHSSVRVGYDSAGIKFTSIEGILYCQNGVTAYSNYRTRHNSLVKGTIPSSRVYSYLHFCDRNGNVWSANGLGLIENLVDTDGKVMTYIGACKNEANSTIVAAVRAVYDTINNDAYGTAPTPSNAADSSNKIATTEWVRTATGNTTLNAATATKIGSTSVGNTGQPIFLSAGTPTACSFRVFGQFSDITKGTNPSANKWLHSWIYWDSVGTNDANRLVEQRSRVWSNGATSFELVAYDFRSGYANGAVLSIVNNNGVKYATAPTPALSANTDAIATTEWVRTATGDTTLNAGTATKLATARNLKVALNSTTDVTFDGSANQNSIPVSGVLPIANGGTGSSTKNFVDLTSGQTVSGMKTFTENVIIRSQWPHFSSFISDYTYGSTLPSANRYAGLLIYDSVNKIIGVSEYCLMPSGDALVNTSVTGINQNVSTGVSVQHTHDNVRLFRPNGDNILYLGSSGNRWKDIYAANTSIETSDERLKLGIADVSSAALDAWEDVGFRQFRFTDAVAEKGEARARLHVGLVAQDIDRVFGAHGLSAADYGLFCYDEWDASPLMYAADGKTVVQEARAAGDRYSLRYGEALCMEAAYQRRENARLKKRIADLEERLAALELKVS